MENTKKKLNKKQLTILITAISVILIAAVVICIFIFAGKDNKGDVSGDASGDAATTELSTDEAAGADTKSKDSSDTDSVTGDNKTDVTDNSASTETTKTADDGNGDGYSETSEDIDDDLPVSDLPEDVTIVEKTEEKDKWPADKIPNSVPACKYVSLDRCSVQDDGNQKVWFMSWVSTVSDYEVWIKALGAAGFKEGSTMPGRYANGSEIVDVYIEEDTDPANYWVSVEIYTSTPVDYKSAPLDGVFPEFNKGDSTLQYWVSREDGGKFICQYAGSQDWEALLNAYMNLLSQNGFTVENYTASKTVNGKVYSVYLKGEQISSDEMIVYMY